jgi:peptidoglycan biosynthesis protein MviN/MurJ (putative lipid II flippase)
MIVLRFFYGMAITLSMKEIMLKINIFKTESYRKGIVLSTLFNVAAKLLGFATTVVIAYFFGTEDKTGLWFTLIATIFLISAFVNNLNSSVLIPESMRLSEQKGKENSVAFLNFFIYGYLLIGLFLTTLIWADPVKFFSFISNYNFHVLQNNRHLLICTAFLLTLNIISTLLTDILISYKYFTLPMISNMMNNIACLLMLLLFYQKLGILCLAYGFLIGNTIQIILLIYLMRHSLHWNFVFKFIRLEKRIIRNIIFAQVGNVTSTLSSYAPYFLLSGFSTIIASMTYAQRVADIPTSFLTAQFSSVAGIKMNELYSRKEWDKLNKTFQASMRLLFWFLIPLTLLTITYSQEIITIIFQRGAFNQESVNSSSQFLRYFALLFPLLALNSLVSRLFMSAQKIMESFWYQIVMNVILISGIFIFVNKLGFIGYPIALVTMQGLNALFIGFFFHHFFPAINFRDVILYGIKIGMWSIALVGIIYPLKHFFFNHLDFHVNFILGVLLYFTGWLILNTIFGIHQYIYDLLKKFRYSAHNFFIGVRTGKE